MSSAIVGTGLDAGLAHGVLQADLALRNPQLQLRRQPLHDRQLALRLRPLRLLRVGRRIDRCGRRILGGAPGPDTQPVAPRTADDAKPESVSPPAEPKEAKRAEAQRKLAVMQKLPSALKLRVAMREISLEDAMREAGIDPE